MFKVNNTLDVYRVLDTPVSLVPIRIFFETFREKLLFLTILSFAGVRKKRQTGL